MSEQVKTGLRSASEIIQTVVLFGLTVALGFMFNGVIDHGKELAVHRSQIGDQGHRLDQIELKGSRGLESHVISDDTRVEEIKRRIEKLENAVVLLQATPGELKAMNERLDELQRGQVRIEKAMEKGKP